MLKGTTRQGIWHVLTGLVVPNKSLLPSWATTGNRDVEPLWWTRQAPGSIGTSLNGGLKNTLRFSRAQGYKQNRQVSPSGSQQLTIKGLTGTLHPRTLPHLSCPELCLCTHPAPIPGNEQVSVQSLRPQSHGLLSQQQGVFNACALQPRKAVKERKDGDQESSRRILFVFACRMQAGALTRASTSLVCLCDNVPFLRNFQESCQVQSNTPLCDGKSGW